MYELPLYQVLFASNQPLVMDDFLRASLIETA